MYGEPRGGIFQHIAGVLQYRKRARLREAHTPESSQPAATRGRRPKGAAAITPVSRHGANFIRIIADRPPLSRGGQQPQLTAEDLAAVEPVSSCTFTGWDTAFSISAWSTHPAAPLRAIGSVSTAPMALPATPYTTKIRLNTTASPSCRNRFPQTPRRTFRTVCSPATTPISGCRPTVSPRGVRPGILSKSRLVFYGTLPNFL